METLTRAIFASATIMLVLRYGVARGIFSNEGAWAPQASRRPRASRTMPRSRGSSA